MRASDESENGLDDCSCRRDAHSLVGHLSSVQAFRVSDLSGYDRSLVPFKVWSEDQTFGESDGAKTMRVTLVYPTEDRARLRRKARAVCRRCAAEMRRLLPNDHRAVTLTVYGDDPIAPPKEGECQWSQPPAGALTIDDPTRETAIPNAKENWH